MIFILLPAYNEAENVTDLLDRIRLSMSKTFPEYRVVLVDDGCTDHTVESALEASDRVPLEIVHHKTNLGLGQAMQTGFERVMALSRGDDIVVTMDCDNSHDPALIEAMVSKVEAGEDVVIASRYASGGEEIGLAGYRSVLSRGASSLLRIFFPIPGVKDYTCGYRAYRVKTLVRARDKYEGKLISEKGFTCMAEVLIKLSRLTVRMDEVPLVLRYDLKRGKSKMKYIRTIARYFSLIARHAIDRPARSPEHPPVVVNPSKVS